MNSNLTFRDVFMISATMLLWTFNDVFMADMRYAHIPAYVRYPLGFLHWAIMMGIAAGFWRLVMGKGKWS